MQTTAESLQHQQLQNYFQTRLLLETKYMSLDCQTCAKVSGRNSFSPTLLSFLPSVDQPCVTQNCSFCFFFFVVRLLTVASARVLLSPSQVSWCCTLDRSGPGCAAARCRFKTRSLSHIHAERDRCGTCAAPAPLCCSPVSHISVWKNGQRSGE